MNGQYVGFGLQPFGPVVAAEVEQRRAAAREYTELGRPDHADRLHAEADVLAAHLRS